MKGRGEELKGAHKTADEALLSLRRFLSLRERSENEVRTRLIQKGFRSQETISIVLEKLRSDGFLNNERFAINRIESRIGRGYGPVYIKQELSALRIDSGTIRTLLAEFSDERYVSHAIEFAEKRLPGLIREENAYEKLMAGLRRRGFTLSQIDSAMSEIQIRYPHWASRRVPHSRHL